MVVAPAILLALSATRRATARPDPYAEQSS